MPITREEQRRIDELAGVSKEERDARRAAYDAHVRHQVAAGEDGGAPWLAPRPVPDATPFDELLARVTARGMDEVAARMALPCYRAMYPDGVEPAEQHARVADAVGAAACEDVGAWHECERARTGFGCPRVGATASYDRVRENLAHARVPKDDYGLVLGHAAGKSRLLALDSMLLVAAVRRAADLHRRGQPSSAVVKFKEATELLVGDRERKNAAQVRGDERVVLMGGAKGRGKTTAAIYALGYEGGLYSTEYEFTRPSSAGGIDVTEAKRAKVLVVDQFGRGHLGDSRYALAAIEEVIDARKADKLLTFLVGNFSFDAAFRARYDELVASRIMGYGVVVVFRGPDLRERLRDEKSGAAA